MFSVNPSGSNPKSPIMDPSSVAGDSRKGNALLFAIITVLDDAEEVARCGAAFTPNDPLGTGMKAWAPAQHIASTANDFIVLYLCSSTCYVLYISDPGEISSRACFRDATQSSLVACALLIE